tara:strand:- start:7 stop:2508 length:2502 start_codon:yes stop_codon:yes gene_type:complete
MKKISNHLLTLLVLFLTANFSAQEDNQDDENSYIEEIVTATARETTVLDVPYNISTLSGVDIASRSILDNSELLRNFVGISSIDRGYRNAGTTSNIRIRGLNVDSSLLQDYPVSAAASVSTYVDNTPVFANFLLKDLKRVEVLRGPQGTLYGSGSLGGTIRYITNDPVVGVNEGSFSYTASSVDGSDTIGNAADLVYNLSIGEKFAYRVVLSKIDYPGITDYVNVLSTTDVEDIGGAGASIGIPAIGDFGFSNFFTAPPVANTVKDADTVGVDFMRHKILVDLTENIDLTYTAIRQEDNIGGRRQASYGTRYVLSSSCVSLLDPNCYNTTTYGKYENGALMLEPSNREVEMSVLEVTYDAPYNDLIFSSSSYERSGDSITDNTGFFAGTGTFTSPAYGYFNDFFGVGGNFATPPRPYAPTERQYTNDADTMELRLVSDLDTFDMFDYVVGIYDKVENQSRAQQTYVKGSNLWNYYYWGVDYIVDPLEQDFDYNVAERIKTRAYFGELTYDFTSEVDVTIGVRNFQVDAVANMNSAFKLYDVFPVADTDENNESGRTTKINISYRPEGTGQHFFLTSSEGFRRGGVNAVPTDGPLAEDLGWVPFESDSVQNIEFGVKGTMDNGTYYNISYYLVEWENPQLNTATPINGYYAVINGDEAETNGFDVELSGTVGNFDWGFGYAYNQSRLTSDLFTPADTPVLYAKSGAKLPGSPEHTLNLNLARTRYFSGRGGIFSGFVNRLDLYAQSETRNYIGSDPLYDAEFEDFRISNASTTFFNDSFYVSLFIKNISNERGITGAFLNNAFGPNPSQGFYGSNSREFYALPRTVGITINRAF